MKRFYLRSLLLALGVSFMIGNSTTTAAELKPIKKPAKSVILIFLTGGPSQTDTFDPKPDAGRDYAGQYKAPIKTNVEGIYINENLKELAKITDKYSIIRSMSHGSNAHETGQYVMYTGDMSRGTLVYPSFGSMISYQFRDSYKGLLPPYISVPNSSTRFNESGFLGVEYKSYNTGGAPERKFFEVEGIINRRVPNKQLEYKKRLLDGFNKLSTNRVEQTSEVEKYKGLQEDNFELILGESRKIFDLESETPELRKKYGMTRIGQSCLVARKLVEAGTPVVVVNSTGWDTHKEHFKRMNQMLSSVDMAISALITDLEDKGLLDDTIILCGGEFGRTPRIGWEPPWNGGRGHFGAAFSYLVAGGGFKGGVVIGETDKTGENVTKRPVYPADFWGTIYYMMGIDPNSTYPHVQMGEIPILPPTPTDGKFAPSEGIVVELIEESRL
ncbi:MAG: DUF1501 domain-containing protein [Rikenellaceae bacterium]